MLSKVIEVIDETPDTRTIRFEVDTSFTFKPGQFVMINADVLVDGEKKFVKRAYSISSSPLQKGYIDLTVKTFEIGLVSKRLYFMKKDEQMDITGPYGHFVFDENLHKHIALIGAGSGITPLACMMRYIQDKNLDNIEADIVYSSKTPSDIIFREEFLRNKKRNIRIHLTITRPDGNNWNRLTGRINEEMIKQCIKDINLPYYYIAGPTQMVEDTSKMLKEMGVKEEKIKLERFGANA
jgi:ferredoxin-NADP reductase